MTESTVIIEDQEEMLMPVQCKMGAGTFSSISNCRNRCPMSGECEAWKETDEDQEGDEEEA